MEEIRPEIKPENKNDPEEKKPEALPPLPSLYEILKGMSITELAEFICYRCDGTGGFCGFAIECNQSKEADRHGICLRWLKMQAQKRE